MGYLRLCKLTLKKDLEVETDAFNYLNSRITANAMKFNLNFPQQSKSQNTTKMRKVLNVLNFT